MCFVCAGFLFRSPAFFLRPYILPHMSYDIEDIQGLMNDLSTIGLSRKSLVFKTHYGFGKDLKGVSLLDKPDPKTDIVLDDPNYYRTFLWNDENFDSGNTII